MTIVLAVKLQDSMEIYKYIRNCLNKEINLELEICISSSFVEVIELRILHNIILQAYIIFSRHFIFHLISNQTLKLKLTMNRYSI